MSGFFARLTPEIVGVGAGCHSFDPVRLRRFRQAVADRPAAPSWPALRAGWRPPATGWAGRRLGARSRGLPSGGPATRFLLHKVLFVHRDEPADDRVHSGEILEVCARHWRALAPLHRWVTDNVQD